MWECGKCDSVGMWSGLVWGVCWCGSVGVCWCGSVESASVGVWGVC